MRALVFFRRFFFMRSGAFVVALALSTLTLAAGTALLGVSGWFLTGAALTTAGLAFNLFGPSALVRGLSMLRIVSRYFEKLVGHDATLALLSSLRGWQFRALAPRVPFQRNGLRHGDIVSRLSADIDALDTVFLTAVSPLLSALAIGCCVTAILAFILPQAASAYVLGFSITLLALPGLLVITARASGERSARESASMRMCVFDGIEGHADLHALGLSNWINSVFAQSCHVHARARNHRVIVNAIGAASSQALAGITMLLVLWFGLDALDAGTINGPLLVGLLLAVLASFEAAGAVARYAGQFAAAQAAAARIRDLSTRAPSVFDPGGPRELPPGSHLTFNSVSFGYEADRPIIRGLDLSVSAGERIAILGPSGSGKSTILHLMLRLMDVTKGTVQVVETDVREVTQATLHRRVALLSQHTPIFLGTIRENLLIGDPFADDDSCWRALAAARLESFVRMLPLGLETWLGEDGRTLSTGQARRLCLARVLLSPAQIIALDEPTSGLDRETELSFLEDLAKATAGRTVLLATHASIPDNAVDRVLRIEAGQLVPVQ